MLEQLWSIREQVRTQKPLVVNVTNVVVTNFTANVLLAAGASPIMSEGVAEAQQLAGIANALVLNMGTLHQRQIEYFLQAGQAANSCGTPVIFDPVGAGATDYRNQTAATLMDKVKFALIRGNYGEINFLTGIAGQMKGVDSIGAAVDMQLLQNLAHKTDAIIAATGKIDYLTDGERLLRNATGHELSQLVTGTGCALSSLCGAFLAIADDKLSGVMAAMTFYGACAQKAAAVSNGPGSFAAQFLDALYTLSFAEFREFAVVNTSLNAQ